MKAFTRQGREQWQADLDSKGRMTAVWAEKFATGTLLSNADQYSAHVGEFDWKRDISSHELRLIWAAWAQITAEGNPVNAVSIADTMTSNGTLDELPDGMQYLLELLDQTESAANPAHFVDWLSIIVKTAAMGRFLSGLKSVTAAATHYEDLASMRTAISKLAEELPTERNKREGTLSESVNELLEGIAAGLSDTMNVTIAEIDAAIGGLAEGELIVIGGRPSWGKTLVASQMLDEAALHGIPSLILSEEMSRASLARRALSRMTCVSKSEWQQNIDQVRFDVREYFAPRASVFVREHCGTVDIAERVIGRHVRNHGVKIVAVDYAQLLRGSGANRYEQVSDVSTRMKQTAAKYGIVVLLLAQLNRSIETRPDPTPTLADLKDSGQLEQDADVVFFPFWPIKVDPKHPDPSEYRIYFAKNRNRGVSTPMAAMRIDGARQRIYGQWDDVRFGDER